MSHVSSMVITCAMLEDEPDGGLPPLHAWCAMPADVETPMRKPIEFRELDLDPAVNHSKGMEVAVLAAAGNYYDHDALIKAFPTFPWMFPEDAVLVIHPEHGTAIVVRAKPHDEDELRGLREMRQRAVDAERKNPTDSAAYDTAYVILTGDTD